MTNQNPQNVAVEAAAVIKVKKPRKPRKLSDIQIIVIRLIANMKGCYDSNLWGRESRLAKKLIDNYGRDFMFWIPKPEGYQMNSMMWFYEPLGKNYLSDQLFEYEKQKASPLEERKEISLDSAKIGEDVIIATVKPKTLKDFLKYGQKT